jgi:hypothetical protein
MNNGYIFYLGLNKLHKTHLLCTLSKNPEYLGNVRLRERRLSLINPLVEHRMNYFSLQN